jgi:hypothetical protein
VACKARKNCQCTSRPFAYSVGRIELKTPSALRSSILMQQAQIVPVWHGFVSFAQTPPRWTQSRRQTQRAAVQVFIRSPPSADLRCNGTNHATVVLSNSELKESRRGRTPIFKDDGWTLFSSTEVRSGLRTRTPESYSNTHLTSR